MANDPDLPFLFFGVDGVLGVVSIVCSSVNNEEKYSSSNLVKTHTMEAGLLEWHYKSTTLHTNSDYLCLHSSI